MNNKSAETLVQKQFDAYNKKDIEDWLNTYSPNAKQYNLHGECVAEGREQIRARMISRFSEPDLHANLLSRIIMDNIVIDHELVTRNFPEGKGDVELICIYELENNLIQKASFAFSKKKSSGKTVRK